MKNSESKKVGYEVQQKAELKFYETWPFLIFFFMFVPILIRSFIYTPFHIPSGSMKPTLLVGDYIFVSKFSYGYSKYSFPLAPNLFDGRVMRSEPKRGDIIVFRLPTNPSVDYIKRLIGLPGDRVQMMGGRLYLNGQMVPHREADDFVDENEKGETKSIKRFIETLPNDVSYEVLDDDPAGALDNTPVYTVPDGHYFFMGDNRDNSQDSRVQRIVGFVPEENLVGRADLVFISTSGSLWKFWQWFSTMRTERSFTTLR